MRWSAKESNMKLKALLFILIILSVQVRISFGQEKSEAALLNESPRESCEFVLSSISQFLLGLREEPNSTGFIVIYGEKGKRLSNLRYEQLIRDAIKAEGGVNNRISIIQGENEEALRVQFWKVPLGAAAPNHSVGRLNHELSGIKKPFIYSTKSWDDTICPPLRDLELYSKILLSNPGWRAHLVIYEPSIDRFRRTETELLQKLVKENKVLRTQIRTFYVRGRNEFSDVEFWLVPRKRN